VASVTYVYHDTTVVGVSLMGQQLELAMRGSADYAVAFTQADTGLRVTMTAERLDASITVPMAAQQSADEGDVRGPLVFTLGPTGDADVESAPEVSMEASRMISALTTAQWFFPGLPDRAVGPGDRWVDTVSNEGDAELGAASEDAVVEYVVVGDTVMDGRTLLHVRLSGTSTSTNEMAMGGMQIAQQSEMSLRGHVLWDEARGVMYESLREGSGSGTVRVPMSPQPLPIQVRSTQRARLLPPS
jgi:hypothetical protein